MKNTFSNHYNYDICNKVNSLREKQIHLEPVCININALRAIKLKRIKVMEITKNMVLRTSILIKHIANAQSN